MPTNPKVCVAKFIVPIVDVLSPTINVALPPDWLPGSYRPDELLKIKTWPFVGFEGPTSDKSFILEFSERISL